MPDTDKPRFLATVDAMATLKPSSKGALTPEAKELFWRAMRETWTLEEFQRAATHLLSNTRWMPEPFDFEQLRKQASSETAAEAWTQVRAALRRFDRHSPPSLGPRIDRIVRAMGGYYELAMTNTDAMVFRERRFAELWAEFGESDEARKALPNLAQGLWISGPKSVAQLLPAGRDP